MSRRRGFTLVELLVVIGIITILIAVLLPVLMKVREHGYRTVCLSNVRQLAVAWTTYASEHNGMLVHTTRSPWVRDDMATLEERIRNGSLFPYLHEMKVYRCPNDPRAEYQYLWSYSINHFVYGITGGWSGGMLAGPQHAGELVRPAETIVFIEDARWGSGEVTISVNLGPPLSWATPVSYWHGGSTASFADGHAEFLKWTDARTLEVWKSGNHNVLQGDNADLVRLTNLLNVR